MAFLNKPHYYANVPEKPVERYRYEDSIRKWRDDPEVLVSKPVISKASFYHTPMPSEVYEKKTDEDVKVTATICFEDGSGCSNIPVEVK